MASRSENWTLEDIDTAIQFCISADSDGEKELCFPPLLITKLVSLACVYIVQSRDGLLLGSIEDINRAVLNDEDKFCIYKLVDVLHCAREAITNAI